MQILLLIFKLLYLKFKDEVVLNEIRFSFLHKRSIKNHDTSELLSKVGVNLNCLSKIRDFGGQLSK